MVQPSQRKTIAVIPQRDAPLVLPPPATFPDQPSAPTGQVLDTLARPLRDLRISVTDRCNFRCGYCMPKEVFTSDYPYLPHSDLLTFEEVTRIARQFVAHGVQKIRLTGGEPLLRKGIERLVEQLAVLRTPQGQPLDLTLTTNGTLLTQKAATLKAAGLQRLTVSLDGLDDAVFRAMNDVDFPVAKVLDGIAAAQQAGFRSIKVNMVVRRGVNENQIIPMARHFYGTGIALRFIEYMDVGNSNGWRLTDVVPSAAVRAQLHAAMPLVALAPQAAGETAQRFGYADAHGNHDQQAGEVGFISSVSQAFCGDCNRARLSTQGSVYLCLFAHQGYDLRQLVRGDADDAALAGVIGNIWRQRTDRYSALRSEPDRAAATVGQRKVEMSYIGG